MASRFWAHAISLGALVLAGCQTTPRVAPRIAQPGYVCEVGAPGERGFMGRVVLYDNGRPFEMDWGISNARRDIVLRVLVSGRTEKALDWEVKNASALLRWQEAETDANAVGKKVRLILSSAPRSRAWYFPPFASRFQKKGSHYLSTRWGDLVALSKGADELTIAFATENGKVIRSQIVDRNAFTDLDQRARYGVAQLKAMAEDYKTACQAVDDIDPEIILVSRAHLAGRSLASK